MYYLDLDCAIVPATLDTLPADVPASRMFASVTGASRHADALPVTPVRITTVAHYASVDVIANNWRTNGLTPIGYHTTIETEL